MKYGKSEDNRRDGTTLDLCVIEKMWSDNKNDWVQYYYSHAIRSPSYKAYLPKRKSWKAGTEREQDVQSEDR